MNKVYVGISADLINHGGSKEDKEYFLSILKKINLETDITKFGIDKDRFKLILKKF